VFKEKDEKPTRRAGCTDRPTEKILCLAFTIFLSRIDLLGLQVDMGNGISA
jgi:hypothetical protein